MEYENPTRRYKWFRPRQAARGSITPATNVNYPTAALYNDSSGPQLLMVRLVSCVSPNGGTMGLIAQQGTIGAAGGIISPFVSGEAKPPGALYALDGAALVVSDFVMATYTGSWPENGAMPVAVLQPGWSLVAQSNSLTDKAQFGFMWEAISVDELDFIY